MAVDDDDDDYYYYDDDEVLSTSFSPGSIQDQICLDQLRLSSDLGIQRAWQLSGDVLGARWKTHSDT